MAFSSKPNILHDYASYTYKFTLYMVPKDEFASVMNNESGIALSDIHTVKFSKKVILLESGSTATAINTVNIVSKPSVDFVDVGNIRMQCLQTKGFSFFESVIKACELCGVDGNAMNSGEFFLELTFMGMDDNGRTKLNISTITYPVVINDVKVTITNNGASYDIDMITRNFVTSEDSISRTPTIIVMTDVNDTSEFFSRLETALNTAYERDTTQGQTNVNRCKFVIDDDLKDLVIKNSNDDSPVFDYSLEYDDATGASFSIPSNSAIPTLIEGVMSNVPAVTDMLLNDDIVGKIVHVEPVVTNGEYIPSLNAYTKNITWYVRLKSHYKYVSPTNIDANKQIQLLDENGDLSKVYNYYFTGENTEVISVDLDFSTAYSATLVHYGGIFSNYAKQVGFAPAVITSQDEELERQSSEAQKNDSKYKAKVAYTDNSGSNVIYVDDYKKVDEDLIKTMGARLVKKDLDSNNAGSYTSQSADSKRMEYMNEVNNIRNLTYNSSLLGSIAMEIRGDPHWLMPRNVYIKPDNSFSDPRKMNLIYLKMGFPIDETNPDIRIDEFLSKLYEVIEVTSEFNNGKFTQKLKAYAINSINRKDIEAKIK